MAWKIPLFPCGITGIGLKPPPPLENSTEISCGQVKSPCYLPPLGSSYGVAKETVNIETAHLLVEYIDSGRELLQVILLDEILVAQVI